MPAWAIGLLANVVLKGIDYFAARNSCGDDIPCILANKMKRMSPEQLLEMRKKIVIMFGITKDDLL